MLLSRLIALTRNTEKPAQDANSKSDEHRMTSEETLKRAQKIQTARELWATLQKWASCLEMNALTLTFRGADVANPLTTHHAIAVDKTWKKLSLQTAEKWAP
jgi:hypothetical protein